MKIGFGLLGELQSGGTFDVERRELSPKVWQITETHVHIQGHALIFKTISENEDDVKSNFKPIPDSTSLQQAQNELFSLNPDPAKQEAAERAAAAAQQAMISRSSGSRRHAKNAHQAKLAQQ